MHKSNIEENIDILQQLEKYNIYPLSDCHKINVKSFKQMKQYQIVTFNVIRKTFNYNNKNNQLFTLSDRFAEGGPAGDALGAHDEPGGQVWPGMQPFPVGEVLEIT